MLKKKLIIGVNEITEVLYIGTNVYATGGRKKKGIRLIADRKSGFSSMGIGKGSNIFIPNEEMTVGKHHVKNYSQRKEKRIKTVEELIYNNFQPGKCVMVTLHFKDVKKEATANNINLDFEIKKGDPFYNQYIECININLVNLSNSICSPDIKIDENTDVEDNGDYTDLKLCNKKFKQFIGRMHYRYTNFKYVAVMGKQENGNWHYHMVCNLNYINFDTLLKIWGLGGVYVSVIKNKTELAKVTNYAKKNIKFASKDLKGEKGYLASKTGLNRNIVVRSWADNESLEFEKQDKRLGKEKNNGLKPISKYTRKHTYKGSASDDGLFYEDKDCDCTIKYFTYRIDSKEKFKLLDLAKLKKKK